MIALLVAVTPGFARIFYNGAGAGYDETNSPKVNADGSPQSIEDHIVRAASFFLKARKDTDTILRMVELQNIEGISIPKLRELADRAYANAGESMETYRLLIKRAAITPYNTPVIKQLQQFDYNGFMTQHRLNPVIFQKVESLLKNGDITGIFKQKIPALTGIQALLKEVKKDLDQNNIPRLKVLWKLNETLSEMSLSGSYVARIFLHKSAVDKIKPVLEARHDWK
jgi:hypothetical protein